MKITVTFVCEIDLPDESVANVTNEDVLATARQVGEQALQGAFRRAGVGIKSTAAILNAKPQ